MIRRLRRRHRLGWAVLGPILAGLLAAALLSRPAPPLADSLPTPREDAPTPIQVAPAPVEDAPAPNEQP